VPYHPSKWIRFHHHHLFHDDFWRERDGPANPGWAMKVMTCSGEGGVGERGVFGGFPGLLGGREPGEGEGFAARGAQF
jgi:hypothetical protein